MGIVWYLDLCLSYPNPMMNINNNIVKVLEYNKTTHMLYKFILSTKGRGLLLLYYLV